MASTAVGTAAIAEQPAAVSKSPNETSQPAVATMVAAIETSLLDRESTRAAGRPASARFTLPSGSPRPPPPGRGGVAPRNEAAAASNASALSRVRETPPSRIEGTPPSELQPTLTPSFDASELEIPRFKQSKSDVVSVAKTVVIPLGEQNGFSVSPAVMGANGATCAAVKRVTAASIAEMVGVRAGMAVLSVQIGANATPVSAYKDILKALRSKVRPLTIVCITPKKPLLTGRKRRASMVAKMPSTGRSRAETLSPRTSSTPRSPAPPHARTRSASFDSPPVPFVAALQSDTEIAADRLGFLFDGRKASSPSSAESCNVADDLHDTSTLRVPFAAALQGDTEIATDGLGFLDGRKASSPPSAGSRNVVLNVADDVQCEFTAMATPSSAALTPPLTPTIRRSATPSAPFDRARTTSTPREAFAVDRRVDAREGPTQLSASSAIVAALTFQRDALDISDPRSPRCAALNQLLTSDPRDEAVVDRLLDALEANAPEWLALEVGTVMRVAKERADMRTLAVGEERMYRELQRLGGASVSSNVAAQTDRVRALGEQLAGESVSGSVLSHLGQSALERDIIHGLGRARSLEACNAAGALILDPRSAATVEAELEAALNDLAHAIDVQLLDDLQRSTQRGAAPLKPPRVDIREPFGIFAEAGEQLGARAAAPFERAEMAPIRAVIHANRSGADEFLGTTAGATAAAAKVYPTLEMAELISEITQLHRTA